MKKEVLAERAKRRVAKVASHSLNRWKLSAAALSFLYALLFLDVVAIGQGWLPDDPAGKANYINVLCAVILISCFLFTCYSVCYVRQSLREAAAKQKYT